MADGTELRTFGTFLGDVEDGELHGELTRAIREIVAELHNVAQDQGGAQKATLALGLVFKLDRGVIEVESTVKTALPKRRRGKSIFYATPDNLLTRRNPRQAELPLRDVNVPSETRTI